MNRFCNKNRKIAICLLSICILCICSQIFFGNGIFELQSQSQQYMQMDEIENINAFLQNRLLLEREAEVQAPLLHAIFEIILYDSMIFLYVPFYRLLQVGAILFFTHLICLLLRFTILYRYKQDGKKQQSKCFNTDMDTSCNRLAAY